MKTFNTVSLAAALVLSVGVLGGTAAKADQVVGDARSEQVRLADLDLSTAEGQQVAQARLHKVARTLCARVADELDLSHHQNYIRCVDAAVAKTSEQVQALISQKPAVKLARADVK